MKRIIFIAILILLVALAAWYMYPPRPRIGISLNADRSLRLSLNSKKQDGEVTIMVKNVSGTRKYITWDRNTHARLLGRFNFIVKNAKGDILSLNSFGAQIYMPPYKPPPFLFYAHPGSGAHVMIDPGKTQLIQVNLGNLYDLQTPGSYTVQVTLKPTRYSSDQLEASSAPVLLDVRSKTQSPSLMATILEHGITFNYSET